MNLIFIALFFVLKVDTKRNGKIKIKQPAYVITKVVKKDAQK